MTYGMEIKEITYTPHFKRAYQNLDISLQKKAEQREILFRKNPFDSLLKTHKLHGRLKDFYSFSIDRKTRIVFRFVGRAKAVFLDIRAYSITPYSAAISEIRLQMIQDSSTHVTHAPPHPSSFSLEFLKLSYERELLNRL